MRRKAGPPRGASPSCPSGENQTEGSGPNGGNLRPTVDPVGSICLILSTRMSIGVADHRLAGTDRRGPLTCFRGAPLTPPADISRGALQLLRRGDRVLTVAQVGRGQKNQHALASDFQTDPLVRQVKLA